MDYRFENVNESENENQGYQPQYSYQPQPDTAPEAPQKPKKNRTGVKVTALVLSCALVGGAMGFGGSALQNHLAAKNADTEEAQQASVVYEGSRETSVINIAQIDTSKEMTPAEVYAQNLDHHELLGLSDPGRCGRLRLHPERRRLHPDELPRCGGFQLHHRFALRRHGI